MAHPITFIREASSSKLFRLRVAQMANAICSSHNFNVFSSVFFCSFQWCYNICSLAIGPLLGQRPQWQREKCKEKHAFYFLDMFMKYQVESDALPGVRPQWHSAFKLYMNFSKFFRLQMVQTSAQVQSWFANPKKCLTPLWIGRILPACAARPFLAQKTSAFHEKAQPLLFKRTARKNIVERTRPR